MNKYTTTNNKGFSLIELLVVIGLTALLATLVIGPLVQSYGLISRSNTQIETQAAARATLQRINTLLANAVYVFDNSGPNRPTSTGPNTSLNLWFRDNQGNPIMVTSRHSMVEYIAAARQLEQVIESQAAPPPIDPTTGEPIYGNNLTPGQSGYAVPIVSGRTLGRIFLGLINNAATNDTHKISTSFNPNDRAQNGMPLLPYGNEYEDIRTLPRDQANRYTLWNAEVPVYVLNPLATGSNRPFVPNLGLFHIKDRNGMVNDNLANYLNSATRATQGLRLVIHDPNFFYDNSLAGGDGDIRWKMPGWRDLNGDGLVQIWENWRAVSTDLIGQTSKADAVSLDRDATTNQILYYNPMGALLPDNSTEGWPRVRPLIRFTPAFVQNDAAAGTSAESTGHETPVTVPTSFRTQMTHWANPWRVIVYRGPANANPLTQSNLDYFETSDDERIVHVSMLPQGTPSPDPTTLPDVGPMLNAAGLFTNPNLEHAFTVDPERGIINFAWHSNAMLHTTNGSPLNAVFNNREINLRAEGVLGKRYLDLRTLTTADNPSLANVNMHPLSPTMRFHNDVRIVPGTELVFGPDQRPGPHYGFRVQYTRVPSTASEVGVNQYKINYDDIPNMVDPNDPQQRKGFIEFRSGSDASNLVNINDNPLATGMFDPNVTYKPYGMPEYKANPNYDPSQPVSQVNPILTNVPADPVEVTYRFQMNRANDVVKVDYLSRELLDVNVEVRLYDKATSRSQTVLLNQKIKVRNLQR